MRSTAVVLCNADCLHNNQGICNRKEIAIDTSTQGGCIMRETYVASYEEILPEEGPSSLR